MIKNTLKKAILSICLLSLPLTSSAVSKEELSIGISAEFETLNPLVYSMAATSYMLYLSWRPLIILSPAGKWEPLMIKKIPSIENKLAKKEGNSLVTTIEILDKASWGDGTPMTCKDLEFARVAATNKNVSIPERDAYENLDPITWDAKNPKKCTVKFKKAKYDFYQNYPYPMPSHIEEPIYKQWSNKAEGYDQNSMYVKTPSNPGLYNGPYVVSEVKLGSHLIFVPNPHFHGKKPFFQKIIFKLIPNTSTLEANLRAGTIDMISSPGGLSIDQAIAFEEKVEREKLPYKVVFADGLIHSHIDLNLDHPALKDLKVRRAISHAINKKEMIASLLKNKVKDSYHNVAEMDSWFTKDVKIYKYDRKEANRLLDEAGWKMGPKGLREKDGKVLSLNIRSAAGIKLTEMIETFVQAQLKSVGIETLIKNEPQRVFFSETTSKRQFDMAFFAWVSVPENSPRSILHSTAIPTAANSWSGQNFMGYNNPEMDKLIDTLELEFNAEKRKKISHRIQQLYAEDVPVIPFYFRPNNTVIPAALKNFRLSGHKYSETLFAEDWSL